MSTPATTASLGGQPVTKTTPILLPPEDAGNGVIVLKLNVKKLYENVDIQRFLGEVLDVIGTTKPKAIVISMENIEYVSSAGIRAFISIAKELRLMNFGIEPERGLEAHENFLVLCSIDPQIYEAFEVTKLTRQFNITRTKEEAITAAKKLAGELK